MISQVGQPPRLSQSEWIWNRVILIRHQSPAVQSSYLQSRSPKELEVIQSVSPESRSPLRFTTGFLPNAMRRFLDEGNSNTFAQKNNLKSKISLQTLSSLAMLSPSLQRITSVVKFCR